DVRSGEHPMTVGKRAADRLLRCLVERIPHASADEAKRERRATGQCLGERNSGGQCMTGRREAVDQPDAMRLPCVDQVAGIKELVSLRWTHKPWKPENAAASGEDAELHLGKADTCRLVHDANIVGER